MQSWAVSRAGDPPLPKHSGLGTPHKHPELEGCVLPRAQNKHPQAQIAGCLFPVRLSVKLNQHMKAPGIYSNDKKQSQHTQSEVSRGD